MHEYSVALNIADLVLQHSQGKRIEKVNLSIGDMSGVFYDSLAMYLQLVFEEKGHKDVVLNAQFIPATFVCACGKEYVTSKMSEGCPACGGYDRKITAGKDCLVESIEVNDEKNFSPQSYTE
jgi:hydrogenase nickel incorporation protein HypA/HybF